MGIKSKGGDKSAAAAKKKLAKLGELPATLDRELQTMAMQVQLTAINMAPIYTEKLRHNIIYRRVGSQRDAKGRFVKGGLGVHIIEFKTDKADYFDRVLSEMTVGRITEEKNSGLFQPSKKSVETARAAGEIAGGLFMQRAMLKHENEITAKLQQKGNQFIKMIF